MNTYRFKFTLAVVVVLIFFSQSQGQSNMLFYHTEAFYNAPDYNPAFLTNQKDFTFNVFPVAGMGLSINNGEAIGKAIEIMSNPDADDQSKELLRILVKKDLSYNQMETNLVNLGFNSAYGSFNFMVKEKAYALARIGGDFSRFIANTTGNETIHLDQYQNFPGEAAHLREYSLGYANELVRNKLNVGFRLKLYYGKAFIASTVSGKMITDGQTFYAQSNGDVFISIPASDNEQDGTITKIRPMDGQSISDYVFNKQNSGLGMDLGISWKINPQVEISASVLDLGGITWKKYLYHLDFDEGQYEIQNVHLDSEKEDILVKDADEVDLVDHIEQLYDIIPTEENYKTNIPTTFYAGLNYKLSSELSIGLINRYILAKDVGYNSFSALANYKYSEKLTIISGLGFYGSSFNNIPLGIQYRWKSAQFYIGTDNFLSVVVPNFSDFSSLTFGVDLNLFGPKVRYENVEYLPFFKLKKQRKKRSNGLLFNGI